MFRRRVLSRPFLTAVGVTLTSSTVIAVCDDSKKKPVNSAFVFIKPHANTTRTQTLVQSTLAAKGIKIQSHGELTAERIDEKKLIDQHYYAIASKATLMQPKDLPVPADKFQKEFGLAWNDALKQGVVYNALDACKYLGIDAEELDKQWGPAKKVKFGGGFYCGKLELPGKKAIYVFNGFFMSMRAKFVTPGTSIHWFCVDFDSDKLSWADFRGKVLGPTDPKDGPADSLRGKIFRDWKSLGLGYEPNVGYVHSCKICILNFIYNFILELILNFLFIRSDNGVHASASPFEGLAERMNWLEARPEEDTFGAALIASGVSSKTIKAWSVDPQVKGKSLFDQLEDLDAPQCVAKAQELAK